MSVESLVLLSQILEFPYLEVPNLRIHIGQEQAAPLMTPDTTSLFVLS
jgi:hypothetical protein